MTEQIREDRARLRETVFAAVKAGARRFADIQSAVGASNWHHVDRALQSLRRAGLAAYDHTTGWTAVEKAAA
jgi:hypothetical protein